MPKILGISASHHPASISQLGLKTALEAAVERGATTQILRLSENPLPLFNPSVRGDSNIAVYRAAILEADALILATPDYHGGPSGALKNCLDFFWKELAGKLVGYICASHEKGLLPMEQLRITIRQCYGWSLPYGVALSDSDVDPSRSKVMSENVNSRLRILAYDLVRYGPTLRKFFDEDRVAENRGFASRYKD